MKNTRNASQQERADGDCLGTGNDLNPLLSVIVPVYNVERYLRRCLDSLCAQRYPNLEIICVDDGSKDGSLAILREYEAKDSRIRVVSKPNGGLGSARNAGLDVARGEWVASVDSDDYLLPETYSTTMPLATPEVDMVCFGMKVVAEPGSGKEEEARNAQNWATFPYEGVRELDGECLSVLRWNFVNKLFRRALIEDNHLRFDESNFGSEDLCFHMRYVAFARKAWFLPERFYVYVLRAGSIMHSPEKTERWLESYLSAFSNIMQVHNAVGRRAEYAALYSFLFREIFNAVRHCASMTDNVSLWLERLCALAREYGLQEYAESLVGWCARLQRKCRYYKLKSLLTWGRKKKHCRDRQRSYHDALLHIRQFINDSRQARAGK